MKSIFKYLAIAAMGIALTGLVACEPDPEPEPEPTPDPGNYTESSTFSLKYKNNAVAAGDTIVYVHTTGLPMVDFYIVNKTQENHNAFVKVEKLEGPSSMNSMGFCTDVCDNFTCPFVAPKPSRPFTIPAGNSGYFDLQILNNVESGTVALYRLTIGSGQELEDPQVVFLKITI